MTPEAEAAFRRDLEGAGEASVRADFSGGGGLATGGEDRRKIIREWLREREKEREDQQNRSERYLRLTFWVAVGALIASVVGIIVTVLQK